MSLLDRGYIEDADTLTKSLGNALRSDDYWVGVSDYTYGHHTLIYLLADFLAPIGVGVDDVAFGSFQWLNEEGIPSGWCHTLIVPKSAPVLCAIDAWLIKVSSKDQLRYPERKNVVALGQTVASVERLIQLLNSVANNLGYMMTANVDLN